MSVFKYIFNHIYGAIFYKKGSILLSSIFTGLTASIGYELNIKQFLINKLNTEEMTINLFVGISIFIVTFFIVLADIIFGLIKAKYLKQDITPAKGLVGIIKFIVYSLFIFIIMVFQGIALVYQWDYVSSMLFFVLFSTGFLINLWEFKSIGKNIELAFGKKMKVFNMIDTLIDVVEKQIVNRLRGSSMCNNDKTE